jgi:ABC-type transport system involved in multi-copper enzyme maturation permease subunit
VPFTEEPITMSKAVTKETPPGVPPWQEADEGAPSVLRRDEPGFARVIGTLGAACVIFGGVALLLNRTGKLTPLGNGGASFFLAVGLAGLLFHAAFDWDVQFRRIYMGFGYLALVVGGPLLCLIPYPNSVGDQFGFGVLSLTLGLLFLLAFLRNETDPWLRQLATYVLGGAGAIMAVAAFLGGNVSVDFLLPYGALLGVLGLIYLTSFINLRGTSDDRAYYTAVALALLGALVIVVALVRTFVAARPVAFLVPSGVLLVVLGLAYLAVGYSLFSDRPFVVLTRRELGAFFFSPMAYILLLVCVVAYGIAYFVWTIQLLNAQGGVSEPILRPFVIALTPVIFLVLVVPALTMRLLSEERRTGTFEVLMTVPVGEVVVALSKFTAAFLMFLVTWVPFGLFLIYLRIDGGSPFDYRPLLSFFVALCVTGAAFVAMGVFFSSLTRNQIASFLLTAAGMLALTLVYPVNWMLKRLLGDSTAWSTVLTHASYLDLWDSTLDGRLVLRNLLFFASLAIVWLFLTVKVLEARKWL